MVAEHRQDSNSMAAKCVYIELVIIHKILIKLRIEVIGIRRNDKDIKTLLNLL